MVFGIGNIATRTASFFGSSAARAGIGGVAGGMLVDDIPFIGTAVDPTESNSGGSGPVGDIAMLGVLAVAALLAFEVVSDS